MVHYWLGIAIFQSMQICMYSPQSPAFISNFNWVIGEKEEHFQMDAPQITNK